MRQAVASDCSAPAAYHRFSTAAKMAPVRFPEARTRDKSAAGAYVAIVPDERFPGMYRLKRTDGSLSDMVNLTRAKDALAAMPPPAADGLDIPQCPPRDHVQP